METWDPVLGTAIANLAVERSPANHRAVAAEYARLKIRDMAHDHYTSALTLDPTDAAAYDGRARLWRDYGFPERGLGDAYRARHYAPGSAEAANTLGTLFEGMGKLDDALGWYERAVAIDPTAWFALNNICHVQMRRGQSSAVEACERALEGAATPSNVAFNNLALAHAAAGDFERARARFAAGGDEALTAYNMGIVFLATRRFADAEREFRAAWRARPSMALASERVRQAIALQQTK